MKQEKRRPIPHETSAAPGNERAFSSAHGDAKEKFALKRDVFTETVALKKEKHSI